MRYTAIYMGAVVLAFLGACAHQQDLPAEEGGTNGTGTPLAVRSSRAADGYEPFAQGDAIYVYYAYQNLSDVYPWLRGKYICQEADKAKEWRSESSESIYKEDLKKPNFGEQYWFTAVSLPEPKVEGSSFYAVQSDQTTTGYQESDFRIARAVYPTNWDKATLAFHFRHVLSRLRVQILLPKGNTADGYFADPAKLPVQAAIQNKVLEYGVIYDNVVGDRGILKTTLNEAATRTQIQMHSDGAPGSDKVDIGVGTNIPVAVHTFSAILPKQGVVQGESLLHIKLDEKSYAYTPPKANTVTLEQEQVTTIRLILLSSAGQAKMIVESVKQTPWKEDQADVGDLLPL